MHLSCIHVLLATFAVVVPICYGHILPPRSTVHDAGRSKRSAEGAASTLKEEGNRLVEVAAILPTLAEQGAEQLGEEAKWRLQNSIVQIQANIKYATEELQHVTKALGHVLEDVIRKASSFLLEESCYMLLNMANRTGDILETGKHILGILAKKDTIDKIKYALGEILETNGPSKVSEELPSVIQEASPALITTDDVARHKREIQSIHLFTPVELAKIKELAHILQKNLSKYLSKSFTAGSQWKMI